MTTPEEQKELDKLPYAERIAKLLRKAEGTDNAAEAEAYTEMAQRLMVKYAIDEELIAIAAGTQVQDTIVTDKIQYDGIFHMAFFDIGNVLAHANNCRTLITKQQGSHSRLTLIGFSKDVANVKMLDASLAIQASSAMRKWYDRQDVYGFTPMMKAKMRRQFIQSFAQGLRAKLAAANRAGTEDAAQSQSERAGVDIDTARKSTDLVIQTKVQKVDEWMDHTYGRSLRTVRRNYSFGGYSASSAGYAAGMNANVGQTGLGAGRREIGQ